MVLSIESIEAAQPGDTVRDKVVPGLHLRVTPLKKSFYLYYITKSRQERKPKLGDFPTITLTAARRISREMLVEVAAGGDPMGKQRAENAAPTVSDLCDRYLDRHAAKKKTADLDRRYIRLNIKPTLGKLKVADVRLTDVEDVFVKMKANPSKANRFLAIVSKMMNLAEAWEFRPQGSNPCRHIQKYAEHKRKRYLSREEASAIVERLHFYTDAYPESVAFLWLLIYTGARPSEIAALRPEHRNGAILTLTEHKTAKKTQDVRTIHLPAQAVAILDGLRRRKETLLGIEAPRRLWRRIIVDTKIKNLRMYDLRHTFASVGISNGLTLSAIGELMGHRHTATTQRYAHLIDEAAQAAVAVTADAFDAFAKPILKVIK